MARVSVIVPAFDAAATLDRAAESALRAGDGVGVEVVIVNDGSTDGTARLADAIAARDARVRVVHQPNRGLSAARNAGLDAASGDRVVFLDADDELLPGGLHALSRAIDDGAAGAIGGFVMRSPAGDEVGRVHAPVGGVGLEDLLGMHFLIVPSVMLRADTVRAHRFDPARARVEDYDLWFRLALHGDRRFRFAPVSANVCAYRLAPGTMSADFEGMLAHGQQVVARAFAAARDRAITGVDASEARERAVLSALAMSWATRAAVVGGAPGASACAGLERAESLMRLPRVPVQIDAERAAGHAVSAIRMGLAERPRVGDMEPAWFAPLLEWWARAIERGWIMPGSGRAHSDPLRELLSALAERMIEPEAIADALLDDVAASTRTVVVAGMRANGQALAQRAAQRGMAVRVRDERGAASAVRPYEYESADAPVEAGWALVLTNADTTPFSAVALSHRVRNGTVHSWYTVRARLAESTRACLLAWSARLANHPACPAA